PEVMLLGLGGILKACAISEANHQPVACHQAQSPFCTAVNAHIHSVIPNFLIQECFDDSLWPGVWDLLEGVPRVENGFLAVSDRPGWGVELNEAECEKYPYSPKNFLRLFEDGWESRLGER
ncbi:MAG: enolase C-terminal domain-like protein, partial [Candidatus Limiplasma sp.]|nr:enolase C-terminal domain-like protein [Candidatus Limiplasma sp.]